MALSKKDRLAITRLCARINLAIGTGKCTAVSLERPGGVCLWGPGPSEILPGSQSYTKRKHIGWGETERLWRDGRLQEVLETELTMILLGG